MPRAPYFRLLATTSFTALAGGALADVSAGDVWAHWQDQLSAYGESEITIGGESRSGKSLTIETIEIRSEANGGASSVQIPQIIFTENGDGTVTVTLPAQIPITFSPESSDGDNRAALSLQSTNAVILVSGSPEALIYDFSADRMTLSATEIIEDGEPVPADILFNANGLRGQARQSSGEMQDFSNSFTARSVGALFGVDDGSNRFDLSAQAADISTNMEARLPEGATGTMEEFRESGGYFRATYASGAATFVLSADEDGEATNVVVGSARNSFDMNIAAETIAMGSESADVTVSLSGDAMPYPISFTAKALGQSFTFPVLSTEEPMPMGMTLNISDLALDNQIWGILDPFGAVPHEPMTLQYAVDGTGRLRYDLDDPDRDERIGEGENPFELYSANISGLRLAFAGAELTGEGAFTFDNSDLETFPGMPRPAGWARLEAIGINSMFDRLATVGLLPEEQLMGFRMMLGMFADVVGDDHLVSVVEITPVGQILLNGQRLR